MGIFPLRFVVFLVLIGTLGHSYIVIGQYGTSSEVLLCCLLIFLASQDAIEVMSVTHSLSVSIDFSDVTLGW